MTTSQNSRIRLSGKVMLLHYHFETRISYQNVQYTVITITSQVSHIIDIYQFVQYIQMYHV